MARVSDEYGGDVTPPPTYDPSGPSIDPGIVDVTPPPTYQTAAPVRDVPPVELVGNDPLAQWAAQAATPIEQPTDTPPSDILPYSHAFDAYVRGTYAGLGRGAFQTDAAYQEYQRTGYPVGASEFSKAVARGAPGAQNMLSTDVVLGQNPFGRVIGDVPAQVARAIGSGQSALDVLTVHADAIIPGPGQGTLKQRYDQYISEGAAPDVAANAAMRDYGNALQHLAEDPNAGIGWRGSAQAARLLGLAQSITAPAPVPGGATLPFVAGALEKGGAKALTERFFAQGNDVVNLATGVRVRQAASVAEAQGIADRLNALPIEAFNLGQSRPLLSRIASEMNTRLSDERLIQQAASRLGPPEDLGRVFGDEATTKLGRTEAEQRILELQRERAATGGTALEELPKITYGGGGNEPLRGFQLEKFPESVRPFMAELAKQMDPALAAATRSLTNEDIQTAAQLIGRPVSEVARDLPKRGVTSAQIQMVRQGVAAKVMAATQLAAKAQVGNATSRDMWDAIVSLQEAAAIQASLHEAASEAGRALQVLRTEIAPELASNPTALAYMAAISRVARSPEQANVIFTALQKIGNDPDAVYALLREMNKPTLGDTIISIWNMPRALKASMDFSAGGRQALIALAAHPGDAKQFYNVMWNSFRDERFADSVERMLRTGSPVQGLQAPVAAELARLRRSAGVFQAETGPLARLSQREEAMMTQLLGRIHGYRASERAYVTPLNWLRANRFDNAIVAMQRANGKVSDRTASTLAQWVNISTGRGELPAWLASSVPLLNNIFFAPRFAVSRFEAFAFPAYAFAKGESEVAKIAATDMVRFIGEGAALLTLLEMGARAQGTSVVELDPRSPEFGKIKVGDTVIDPWGGEQQVVRNVVQFITGEKKTVTGKNRGDIVPIPRNETIGRFIESKLSPSTGLAWDLSKGATKAQIAAHEGEPFWDQPIGRDFLGNPFSLKDLGISTSSSLFLPMSWGDIYDAAQADRAEGGSGIRGALLGATSLAGVGVTTYGSGEGEEGLQRTRVPRPAGVKVGGYHVAP